MQWLRFTTTTMPQMPINYFISLGNERETMEQYENLEMEVIEFDTEDVITTSTQRPDIETPQIGG